jgi:hypothetical protein
MEKLTASLFLLNVGVSEVLKGLNNNVVEFWPLSTAYEKERDH